MSAQFEFHLKGAKAPEGELDADHLLAIVTSLKEVATKIGRAETDAEPVGRAPKRVHRVAKLLIGLAPGSTTFLPAASAGETVLLISIYRTSRRSTRGSRTSSSRSLSISGQAGSATRCLFLPRIWQSLCSKRPPRSSSRSMGSPGAGSGPRTSIGRRGRSLRRRTSTP